MSGAPLSITLATANDRIGGAGVAASRLRDGLLAQGHDVQLFVQTQSLPHPATVSAKTSVQRTLNRMRSGIDSMPVRRSGGAPDAFSASWLPRRWPTLAQVGQRQLVHLHWTNAGFFSVRDIAAISVPVVWTLHDMWALTGGCQYDAGCDRFAQGCGACPLLAKPARAADLSSRRFNAKRSNWAAQNLTLVAPSRWLAAQARRSPILQGKRVEVLHNGLDLRRFKPLDRGFARQALGLPQDQRLVLFGALNPGSDARKGYDLLQDAVAHLAVDEALRGQLSLVVFGSSPEREERVHGLRAIHFGHLSDDLALALLYAACDVFVAPSRQDNLPNTVAEALACGTPCVAFNIGGMPDLIKHRGNGYLAEPFDAADLAQGIVWCLSQQDQRWQGLCAAARAHAELHLNLATQTALHVDLYRELLTAERSSP